MLAHFIERSLKDFVQAARPGALQKAGVRASDDEHLAAAAAWLMRSIEACGGRASSKGYRFLKGWMPPYPETSGYIIPTLFMLERELGSSGVYRDRAIAIGDWLRGQQQPDGGFVAFEIGAGQQADVFDTGMILLGFNTLLYECPTEPMRTSARAAAEFLVASMDESGAFVRHLSHDMLHTYNVRAAWGLAACGQLLAESRFIEAAMANARWTLRQQNARGYFANNAFKPGGNANMHGTVYVMRGLLQLHELTGDRACLDAAVRAAEALCSVFDTKGMIAAELGPDWEFLSSHLCLTGYAQLAIVLYRLRQMTGEERWRRTADGLVDAVARTQDLRDAGKPHFGAIAGSLPIYGRYAPLQYPNWATKFFIDALIAKRQVDRGERERAPLQLYGG